MPNVENHGVDKSEVAPQATGTAGHAEGLDLLMRCSCETKVDSSLDKPPGPARPLRLVEAVVDSGAEESVAPRGLFLGKVEPSFMFPDGEEPPRADR